MAKSTRTIPDGMRQINFNLPLEVFNKVESLAYVEGVSNSEIYNRAIIRYIELYEGKNGKLKARPKGKGLI